MPVTLSYNSTATPFLRRSKSAFTYIIFTPFPRPTSTGKELDAETGYGYFGARYMDHELMTGWLIVDPMSDKYPNISPYAYCACNPVKLVDPDGRCVDDYFDVRGNYLGSDNSKTNNVRIVRSIALFNDIKKDGNGRFEHEEASLLSDNFSQASNNMTTEAQLNVYQHYNITGVPIESRDNKSDDGGMETIVGFSNGKTTITVGVYLDQNINEKYCDNADEITSMFVHENDHVSKAKSMGYWKWKKENATNRKWLEESAVAAQIGHPSWQGTSQKFKDGTENYLKKWQ